jgi:type I restriction enzyme S subunit
MVKENVMKQTEIGWLPEDWELEILSSVSVLKGRIGWQGLNQSEFTDNDNQPFLITGMNFKDGKIRWDEVYHVSEDRYEIAKDIQLKNDDVLMTKDGTIGKMLYVDSIPYPYKASLNSHLLLFRPKKNKYVPKYLYYNLQFKYFLNHIEENKSGSTFFGLSQGAVGKYKTPLPPLPEQEAIAQALSDADAWIESLEQLIAKKRLIKQGAMQKLLLPAADWEVKKLGEVLQFGSGRDYKHLNGGDIPVYGTGGIMTFVDNFLYDGISVGIGRKGTIDKPVLLSGKFWTVDTLFFTHSFTGVNPNYIYYQFLLIPWREYNEASGVPSLNKNTLEQIEIKIPPLTEQTRIATILSDMDVELEALEAQLGKARKVKQGMMQELLSGRVRLV